MFGKRRRAAQVVIDCDDARRLLTLSRRAAPTGVSVVCRGALTCRDGRVVTVVRAKVTLAHHCDPIEVGAWLGACFAGCDDAWYVDGVPASAGTSLVMRASRHLRTRRRSAARDFSSAC